MHSLSKLKSKVPGIALDEVKTESGGGSFIEGRKEKEKETTTDKIFGLLSPRFRKQEEQQAAARNRAFSMAVTPAVRTVVLGWPNCHKIAEIERDSHLLLPPFLSITTTPH